MLLRTLTAAVLLLVSLSVHAQDPPPEIAQVTPTFGGAGTRITISGSGLYGPAEACLSCPIVPRVLIGHREAQVVTSNPNTIVAIVPEMPLGLYPVSVRVNARTAVAPRGSWFAYGGRAANDRYERVLFPVVIDGEQPGARGSRWVTEVTGRNDAATDIRILQGPTQCPAGQPCRIPVYGRARTTFEPALEPLVNGGGAFLYIEQTTTARPPVAFTLRIRDVSRDAEGWGSELPVVHEREAYINRPIPLLDIPAGGNSRAMLRLYDFDGPFGTTARVRVFAHDTNQQLADVNVQLPGVPMIAIPMLPPVPGYAQADLGTLLPAGFAPGRVRVLVEGPRDSRMWAFVSITNNTTQQVTTVTPQ